MNDKIKYVFLLREDINMPQEKVPTLVCHLTTETILSHANKTKLHLIEKWQRESPFLILLRVPSKEQLLDKTLQASAKGIETVLLQYGFHKACKSKLEGSTVTFDTYLWKPAQKGEYIASAIGPDYAKKIDEITGDLKLYPLT